MTTDEIIKWLGGLAGIGGIVVGSVKVYGSVLRDQWRSDLAQHKAECEYPKETREALQRIEDNVQRIWMFLANERTQS